MELMKHQLEAVENLGNGKILYGGVGSGKTAVALAYYMKEESERDIYVITTAKKRDSLDWMGEAAKFGIGDERSKWTGKLTIDSWQNIWKYREVEDAFFIFDEQRLVGNGEWVKNFLKIVRNGNRWILLSATPGDTWMDYAPIFIANGFYKHMTEFKREHVHYAPFVKYPRVLGYLNERKLEVLRNDMLVEMPYEKDTKRYLNYLCVAHNQELLKKAYQDRWNVFEDRPIKDAAELFRVMRRIVNTDPDRLAQVHDLMKIHPRLIIFYNFNYELEMLRWLHVERPVYEYNGHVKDPVPETDKWVYLVQYVAGAEAWNCTSTDAMVLYSLTYSYKNFEQAQGRIDRLDTPYLKLYYYILVSNSVVDRGIRASLGSKRNFNERKFMSELQGIDEFGEKISEGCEI